MTAAEVAAFPTLHLGITARGLDMPPDSYLLPADPVHATRRGQRCLGIRDTGAGGLLIVGDTTMSGYYVAVDRGKQRVGWARRTNACGSV